MYRLIAGKTHSLGFVAQQLAILEKANNVTQQTYNYLDLSMIPVSCLLAGVVSDIQDMVEALPSDRPICINGDKRQFVQDLMGHAHGGVEVSLDDMRLLSSIKPDPWDHSKTERYAKYSPHDEPSVTLLCRFVPKADAAPRLTPKEFLCLSSAVLKDNPNATVRVNMLPQASTSRGL